MSQLFKTNLEEYARQCTIQRRHYEECLLKAQQSCIANASEASDETIAQAAAGESVSAEQVDVCVDQAAQSCMIELLEMPVEPLGWGSERSVLENTRSEFTETQEWHRDRGQTPHQAIVNPTAKIPSSVGFGAP